MTPNPDKPTMDPYFQQSFLVAILNTLDTKILDNPYHAECKVTFHSLKDNDIERMKTKLVEIQINDKDVNDLIGLLDNFENNIVNIKRLSHKIRQRIRDIVCADQLIPKGL